MPVVIPNAFATASGNVPASQLDANFQALAAASNTQEGQIATLQSTVATLQGPWTDVKTFGAVGDGVANDTAAITAAKVAAAAVGGPRVVYFPPGVYLTEPIAVTESNITFEGAPGATLKVRTPGGPNYKILNISANTKVSVRGLGFDGNASTPAEIFLGLIHGNGSSLLLVERCSFTNTGGWGIAGFDCSGAIFKGNTFVTPSHGIFLQTVATDSFGVQVLNNQMFGIAGGYVWASSPPAAIHLSTTSPFIFVGAVVSDNTITLGGAIMGIAIDKTSGSAASGRGCSISNNTVVGDSVSEWGISTTLLNSVIEGNTVSGCKLFGIEQHGSGNTVQGNTVVMEAVATATGILVADSVLPAGRTVVGGNTIQGTAVAGNRGIHVFQNTGSIGVVMLNDNYVTGFETLIASFNTSSLKISGNWLKDPGATTPRWIWLVQAAATQSNSGLIVQDNRFEGTGAAGIRLEPQGAMVIDSAFITGNNTTGMVTTVGGMNVVAPAQVTNILVARNHGADPTNPLKNLIYP